MDDDSPNWNADDWHLFLSRHCDNRATEPFGMQKVALKIAETIDQVRRASAVTEYMISEVRH